jgi:hypothetical protein
MLATVKATVVPSLTENVETENGTVLPRGVDRGILEANTLCPSTVTYRSTFGFWRSSKRPETSAKPDPGEVQIIDRKAGAFSCALPGTIFKTPLGHNTVASTPFAPRAYVIVPPDMFFHTSGPK